MSEDDPKQSIDYFNPQHAPPPPPPPRKAAGNFILGILITILATIAVITGGALTSGAALLPLGTAWVIGLPVAAIVAILSRRRRGMAAGIFTSMGVVLLIFAGLCFYVIAHI